VLLCPCCSYTFLGDALLIAVLAAVALMLSVVITRPIAMTVRAVIYFLTIAFIVTVVLGELYPVDGNRFFRAAAE
jgi:hypothetical protein